MSQQKRLPREQRRRELLDVARRLFGKKGYLNTEVEEVARAAGVTRPIIYRHFPGGKKEVFLEVLNEHLESLIVSLSDAMGSSNSPRERLRRGLDAYLGFVESNPEGFFLMMNSSEELDEEIGRKAKEFRGRVIAALTQTITDVLNSSGLDPGGSSIYANALLGGVESVALSWIDSRAVDRQTLIRYLLAFIWRGFDGLPMDPLRGLERRGSPVRSGREAGSASLAP